jgi:hypothetical protein
MYNYTHVDMGSRTEKSSGTKATRRTKAAIFEGAGDLPQ